MNLEKEIEERKTNEQKIKLLNQQLIENNEQLRSTIEELDRFAYVASHDLQEPLRKIMLFSDKILTRFHNKIDEEADIYFQKIVKASERMQHLVNDLLKFSKHTNDIYGFEQTNLNEILNEVLSDIEYHIQTKHAKIYAEELPVIWAIPSQIRQLFQNLISNSIKFAREGYFPEITIKSEKIDGSGISGLRRELVNNTFYKIYIQDNGIGFDPKYADDIFVVFKRLHSYHEFEGTGIGLSICKKIVDKHNGYITAESKPDEGATFIITLPEKNFLPIGVPIEKESIVV
jgi:light-regulated signal transduction histidine kinase (bacteriophytochrome)